MPVGQIKSLSEMGWFLTVGTGSQILALVILIYKVWPQASSFGSRLKMCLLAMQATLRRSAGSTGDSLRITVVENFWTCILRLKARLHGQQLASTAAIAVVEGS